MMVFRVLLLSLFSFSLFAFEAPLLPIKEIEAEHIDFSSSKLILKDHVRISHEMGNITCESGTLFLKEEKKETDTLLADRILFENNVLISFTSGATLSADQADIDCNTLEGIFTATPPTKVVYTTFSMDGDKKVPVRATSRSLKAKIAKTESGYTLTDLQGSGAVNIEYMTPQVVENTPLKVPPQEVPPQEVSP